MDYQFYLLKFYLVPSVIVAFISLTLFLIIRRKQYENEKPYRDKITNKAENFLTEMILSNPDKITLNRKLQEFTSTIPLHKDWCKELVVNDMIRFKQSLKGKSADAVVSFYRALNLNKYSSNLMNNYLDHKKCEGLYQFQSLDYKNGVSQIKPFLDNSSKILRSNATMAYISLTDGDMSVFNEFPNKLSLLNTIKIMDIYHERKLPVPKNIDNWIDSNNVSIILLGIKTMVFYNYLKKSKEIIALINHEDDSIKKEAIIAIRELCLYEAEGDLIKIFNTVNPQIKFEILNTLKNIGKQKSIMFLKNEINIESNLDLKLKAVECLNDLHNAALDIMSIQDSEVDKMTSHVRNKYIV